MPLEHTAHDLGLVLLLARSRAPGTALPAQDVLLEILLGHFQSRRDAVQHHADEFAMRLSENADPELSSKTVHISDTLLVFYILSINVTTNVPRNSLSLSKLRKCPAWQGRQDICTIH